MSIETASNQEVKTFESRSELMAHEHELVGQLQSAREEHKLTKVEAREKKARVERLEKALGEAHSAIENNQLTIGIKDHSDEIMDKSNIKTTEEVQPMEDEEAA